MTVYGTAVVEDETSEDYEATCVSETEPSSESESGDDERDKLTKLASMPATSYEVGASTDNPEYDVFNVSVGAEAYDPAAAKGESSSTSPDASNEISSDTENDGASISDVSDGQLGRNASNGNSPLPRDSVSFPNKADEPEVSEFIEESHVNGNDSGNGMELTFMESPESENNIPSSPYTSTNEEKESENKDCTIEAADDSKFSTLKMLSKDLKGGVAKRVQLFELMARGESPPISPIQE